MSHAHDLMLHRRRELEREIESAKRRIDEYMRDASSATARKVLAEQQLREIDETLAKLAELPQS